MTRNEAREILMQILYEMDSRGEWTLAKATELAKERLAGNHIERGCLLLENILTNIDEIDNRINASSSHWKTSRMPKVDLAVLRLACGEIFYAQDIPEAVSINEAINIAKKFSTEKSAKFIHGVLGGVVNNAQ